ncbi:MAG: ABC transporter substrate-binding protein [Alphaproteobacteria bacterium]|nr:ABC transporter substrate-binding protein [Alphaproteobacteria bacterium]
MKWLNITAGAAISFGVVFGMSMSAQAQDKKCEPDKVAEKYPAIAGKLLKIGADPTTPPYVFRDGDDFNKIIGYDADLARAVFECAGVEVEFQLGGWSGLLPALVAGQIDVMWDTLYYTAERAAEVDYVVYMQAGTGAMTQKGNPKNIMSLEDACGSVFSVGLGTVEEAAMRDQSKECTDLNKDPVEIMTYPDVAAGFRQVQNERADIMLSDLSLLTKHSLDNPGVYEIAFKILTGFKIGVAVVNDANDLLAAVSDGLEIMEANGTKHELFIKYQMDPDLTLPTEILRD